MNPSRSRCRGLTLIELLVATAIFALVGVMIFKGLDAVIQAKTHTETNMARLQSLQLTVRYIQRDLSQFIDRPVRDQYGDEQPALEATEEAGDVPLISLTHSGWRNPANLRRSELQRVGYDLKDDTFVRYSRTMLDGAAEDSLRKNTLMKRVNEVNFRFLDEDDKYHDRWPPLNTTRDADPTPIAVEFTLTAEPWGEIRRLVRLPQ